MELAVYVLEKGPRLKTKQGGWIEVVGFLRFGDRIGGGLAGKGPRGSESCQHKLSLSRGRMLKNTAGRQIQDRYSSGKVQDALQVLKHKDVGEKLLTIFGH